MNHGTKVLFFAEGATLAHVTRPLALARSLPSESFDITFARPPAFAWLTANDSFKQMDLKCQESKVFAHRLEQGRALYDFQTLVRYVEDDLALIDAEKPDVIIGDFRLSLSVSARLRATPYITICDAYWSPERPLHPPLPVLNSMRFIPLPLAKAVFRIASIPALRLHAVPMERLRKRFGLRSLGFDLRRCYTDSDLRLFANFRALFCEVPSGPNADFIGPLTWSPESNSKLDFLASREPLVYVTMGSSGDPRALENIIPALKEMGCRIALATAGKISPARFASSKTHVFDYLPGNEVCRHAKLVVCNGGSPTTNQALLHGVPVLGIARNMDQFLNMQAIENFGAGLLMRADNTSKSQLRRAIRRLLIEPHFATRAKLLASSSNSNNISINLQRHIKRFQ